MEVNEGVFLRLLAKLMDRSKAYRQLLVRTEHRCLAVVKVEHPKTCDIFYFVPTCLGFGALNAVIGFNLFARVLHFVLNEGGAIPRIHFPTTSVISSWSRQQAMGDHDVVNF